MQIVTKVSQQKRSSNRLNVFLNDEYAFSISEDVYIKYHVHKGKVLSEVEIEEIKRADDVQRAYLMAINYLSYRIRTESEMRTHLREKDLTPQIIEQVIERLYDEELLNDRTFAATFVRDRINRSSKGPNVIRQELAEKGVSQGDIEPALAMYTYDIQREKALAWGQKEVNKESKRPLRRRKEQLTAKLLRRGFTKDVAFEVVDTVEIEKDEEEEFLLLKKEADKLYTRYENKYEDYELKMRLKQRLYSRGFPLSKIDSYLDTLFSE